MTSPERTYERVLALCICGHPVGWHTAELGDCTLCACTSSLTAVDMGEACAWCGASLNGVKIVFCEDCRDAGLDEAAATAIVDAENEQWAVQAGHKIDRAAFAAYPGWSELLEYANQLIGRHNVDGILAGRQHRAAAWFRPGLGIELDRSCCADLNERLYHRIQVPSLRVCPQCAAEAAIRWGRIACEEHAA